MIRFFKSVLFTLIALSVAVPVSAESSLKDLPGRYQSTAIVNVGFDKQIWIWVSGQGYKKSPVTSAVKEPTEAEKQFLIELASATVKELISKAPYPVTAPSALSTTSDPSLSPVTETETYLPIPGFLDMKVNKKSAKSLCAALGTETVMDVQLEYQYGFRRSLKETFKPKSILKGFVLGTTGKILDKPNSFNMVIHLTVYDKKGKEVFVRRYLSNPGADKEFDFPGNVFHLYEGLENLIKSTRDNFIAKVGEFYKTDEVDEGTKIFTSYVIRHGDMRFVD